MNPITGLAGVGAALLALTAGTLLEGCHGDAEAAGTLTIAQLELAGQQHVEEVRRRAAEDYRQAAAEVAEARRQAQQVTQQGERDIAHAQARADYDVGLKGCDGFGGEARSACIAKVEKRYEQARVAADRISYTSL